MRSDHETILWVAREILPLHQRDWLLKAMDILKLDFQQIGEIFPGDILIKVEYPGCNIPYSWLGMYRMITNFSLTPDEPDLIRRWIFINPSVDGLLALDVLVHELVHAVVSVSGHGERFLEVAKAIGLDNRGPSAGAEEVLLERLRDIEEILGRYPTVGELV